MGSSRKRFPVAANIALASAGAMGGTPGSPTPAGGAGLSTRCTWVSGSGQTRDPLIVEIALHDPSVALVISLSRARLRPNTAAPSCCAFTRSVHNLSAVDDNVHARYGPAFLGNRHFNHRCERIEAVLRSNAQSVSRRQLTPKRRLFGRLFDHVSQAPRFERIIFLVLHSDIREIQCSVAADQFQQIFPGSSPRACAISSVKQLTQTTGIYCIPSATSRCELLPQPGRFNTQVFDLVRQVHTPRPSSNAPAS